jgi:hypothetical protein
MVNHRPIIDSKCVESNIQLPLRGELMVITMTPGLNTVTTKVISLKLHETQGVLSTDPSPADQTSVANSSTSNIQRPYGNGVKERRSVPQWREHVVYRWCRGEWRSGATSGNHTAPSWRSWRESVIEDWVENCIALWRPYGHLAMEEIRKTPARNGDEGWNEIDVVFTTNAKVSLYISCCGDILVR